MTNKLSLPNSVRRGPHSAVAQLKWWKDARDDIHVAVAGTHKVVSANPNSRNYHRALYGELNRWLD